MACLSRAGFAGRFRVFPLSVAVFVTSKAFSTVSDARKRLRCHQGRLKAQGDGIPACDFRRPWPSWRLDAPQHGNSTNEIFGAAGSSKKVFRNVRITDAPAAFAVSPVWVWADVPLACTFACGNDGHSSWPGIPGRNICICDTRAPFCRCPHPFVARRRN
jgi:hypothetical protein